MNHTPPDYKSPAPMSLPPLHGVRVVDLSRLLPGPFCTSWLLRLGAEVHKVEPPEGDYLRDFEPKIEGVSAVYRMLNEGKRLHLLDLKSAAGREALLGLLAEADVLVEGFRPGVMERLGLGAAALRERFPRLVQCAITGYGQHGSYRLRAGHDMNYLAVSGVASLLADGSGLHLPAFQAADVAGGGMAAVAAILAALFSRERTGQGAVLDVAMTEAVLHLGLFNLAVAQALGRTPRREEDALGGGLANYGFYRTQDGGWLSVGALEPQFAAQLYAVTEAGPDTLAAVLAGQPLAYWAERFAAVDACVEPVVDLAASFEHPYHRERGTFLEQRLPGGTVLRLLRFPATFQD